MFWNQTENGSRFCPGMSGVAGLPFPSLFWPRVEAQRYQFPRWWRVRVFPSNYRGYINCQQSVKYNESICPWFLWGYWNHPAHVTWVNILSLTCTKLFWLEEGINGSDSFCGGRNRKPQKGINWRALKYSRAGLTFWNKWNNKHYRGCLRWLNCFILPR